MKFVNRQSEITFLHHHFASEPNSLLFVYGPKSSGKSTLLDKVVHELNTKHYAVNFLDLRGVLIYDFQSFLGVFFPKNIKESAKDIIEGISINIGFFAIKASDDPLLKKNAFKVMEDKLIAAKKRGLTPIIILDEIQSLKDIYVNNERYLVDELLNLFVRLTKVSHTAHVVLATSDSYFIEEIYHNARLKKASMFYFVDHLDKHSVMEWLTHEQFSKHEIETVWRYIGGCPWEIQEIITKRQQYKMIEEACLFFVNDEYGKIFDYVFRMERQKENVFYSVIEKIVKDGYCHIANITDRDIGFELIKQMVAHDFWFYRVDEQKISANSKSIYWAFEKMLNTRLLNDTPVSHS